MLLLPTAARTIFAQRIVFFAHNLLGLLRFKRIWRVTEGSPHNLGLFPKLSSLPYYHCFVGSKILKAATLCARRSASVSPKLADSDSDPVSSLKTDDALITYYSGYLGIT